MMKRSPILMVILMAYQVHAATIGIGAANPAASAVQQVMLGGRSSSHLAIHKKNLGTPFLYMMGQIQSSAPNSEYDSYRPRLVHFLKKGNSIILEDIRPQQQYTQKENSPNLIAQFPITSESNGVITFDFLQGMKRITAQSAFNPDSPLYYDESTAGYIRSIQTYSSYITIDHVAQVLLEKSKMQTVTFRHIFYRDDIQFQPKEEGRASFFFETPTFYALGDSTPLHNINRWDLSHPITVAIDPKTPSAYVPSIRNGILSWNKALDRKIFQIVEAKEGAFSAMDLRYDIQIHWVPDDYYGLAKGIQLANPVTGRIIHGDLLLNSGWPVAMEEDLHEWGVPSTPHGFQSAVVCMYTPDPSASPIGDKLLGARIQSLIMHESGHLLGLRHNFMGNVGSSLDYWQSVELFEKALRNELPADHPLPSTSTMDYLTDENDVLMIQPGPYDIAAIQWGYFGGPSPDTQFQFCTDEDTNELGNDEGGNADCQRHDGGNNPLQWLHITLYESLRNYTYTLLNRFIVQQSKLEKRINPPSVGYIAHRLGQLHNYITGGMAVPSLRGQHSLERQKWASRILHSLRDSDTWMPQEARNELAKLDTLIHSGTYYESLWARQAKLKIEEGLHNLQNLLDSKPGSLVK